MSKLSDRLWFVAGIFAIIEPAYDRFVRRRRAKRQEEADRRISDLEARLARLKRKLEEK